MNDILGAQLYTIREFAKTAKDIDASFKKIKNIGYTTVQASGLGEIEPTELKYIADAHGLKIIITHTPYDRFINNLDKVIKDHKILDCEIAGLGAMPNEYRNGDGYKKFAEKFSLISEELSKSGLKFSYHNHRFEFEKFDGKLGMDILAEETDTENFFFTLDTYWVQAGGADPVEWINKLNGRIEVIHLKDMAIKDDIQIMAEVMEGNLNWADIMVACEKSGVKWYMVEQDICQRNPFDSLRISYNNLTKVGFK